jgi:hypothetical protein
LRVGQQRDGHHSIHGPNKQTRQRHRLSFAVSSDSVNRGGAGSHAVYGLLHACGSEHSGKQCRYYAGKKRELCIDQEYNQKRGRGERNCEVP